MSSVRDFEQRLGEILHDEAAAAAQETDTTRELARLRLRTRRDGAQRFRRVAAVVAAVVAVLALAWGLGPKRNDATPARPAVVDLDGVLPRYQPLAAADVAVADAPAVVSGLGRVLGVAEYDGRVVTFAPDPGTDDWTMSMLAPDRTSVVWRLRYVTGGLAPTDSAGGVAVLALSNGGPLRSSAAGAVRRDGVLSVDLAAGRVLHFTPLPLVSDVAADSDGTVWAATPRRVVHLDARTGRRLGGFRTPGLVRDLSLGADHTAWLSDSQASPTRLYALDLPSGKLRHRYTSAGSSSVVRVPGATLVMSLRTGRVERIADDGTITAVQLATSPLFMAREVVALGSDVWLSIGDRVLRLDGRTLAFEGGIDPAWDGPPYASAHVGNRLLVADPSSGTLRSVPDSAFRRR